jgi:hypothetical protein
MTQGLAFDVCRSRACMAAAQHMHSGLKLPPPPPTYVWQDDLVGA